MGRCYDTAKIRAAGTLLCSSENLPKAIPEFAPNYNLVALIFGANWGYGIDLTQCAQYSDLLFQAVKPGSNIQLVELYLVHCDFMDSCTMANSRQKTV